MSKSEKGDDGFVIASGQPAILLHAPEKAFDFITVAVIFFVQRERLSAVGAIRAIGAIGNNDGNALFGA